MYESIIHIWYDTNCVAVLTGHSLVPTESAKIFLTVEPRAYARVWAAKSAKETWEYLKKVYGVWQGGSIFWDVWW
jgi:hypothetical protein